MISFYFLNLFATYFQPVSILSNPLPLTKLSCSLFFTWTPDANLAREHYSLSNTVQHPAFSRCSPLLRLWEQGWTWIRAEIGNAHSVALLLPLPSLARMVMMVMTICDELHHRYNETWGSVSTMALNKLYLYPETFQPLSEMPKARVPMPRVIISGFAPGCSVKAESSK